jgi:hypothetical protein
MQGLRSVSVPENQPPQSVTSAAFRIGSISSGLFGKRRPLLHAGEPSRARLAQAFFQRHVIAQFRKIIVPPRNGGHAEFGFQFMTPVLFSAAFEADQLPMRRFCSAFS